VLTAADESEALSVLDAGTVPRPCLVVLESHDGPDGRLCIRDAAETVALEEFLAVLDEHC
jgi:hypothetical protein